jgi:hypothetical protein
MEQSSSWKTKVVQPLKKFPASYGTRSFITVFKRNLFGARWIQYTPYFLKIDINIILPSTYISPFEFPDKKFECISLLSYARTRNEIPEPALHCSKSSHDASQFL